MLDANFIEGEAGWELIESPIRLWIVLFHPNREKLEVVEILAVEIEELSESQV